MSDAQQITLLVDGEETKVTTGTTGAELFFERRDVVVARINGELKDLDQPLPEDATVEAVTIDSPDGLNVLRHSAAHVMAQAVQQLRPDAKLGIGPYITDGFYFDFDVEEPFTPEDLKTLEKMMQQDHQPEPEVRPPRGVRGRGPRGDEGRAVQARTAGQEEQRRRRR